MKENPSYTQLQKEVEALRKTVSKNDYLERIYHSIDQPIIILSPDQTIMSANLSAQKGSGLLLEEMIGQKCYQIFHDARATSPPGSCPFQKLVSTGAHEPVEIEEERLQGTFLVSLTPVFDHNHQLKRVIHISTNITDRIIAERKSQENELKFKLVTETIKDVFWMSTCGISKMVYISPGYEILWGRSRQSLYQNPRSFIEALHPDDLDAYLEVIDKYHQKRKFYQCEYRISQKNGDIRWIREKGYPVPHLMGGAHLMTGVCTDVTEQKKAEHALKKSEAKYRKMMESLTDPLYICSPDFKVTYINQAMISRLGRNALGESCYRALHGLDQPCDWCIYDKVNIGQAVEYNVHSPLDRRTYRVTNMPIHNADGTVSKMAIFRDITDYLNAISEKEKVQIRLLQAQKMEAIGTLAGGIAHDFNNILSSIIGFSELAIEDAEKNSILADNLEQVVAAGHRAKNLVKQILVFARQSNEALKPIRIDLIAKEVLHFLRSSIPSTIAIRPNIWSQASIMGNPTQVHQIFMNLCTNAAHAMEKNGGILDVGVKDVHFEKGSQTPMTGLKPGSYVEISVLDTGAGISSENLDAIFDPYFTTKDAGKGTGMGLSVVHGIVVRHGGRIHVDSRPGHGTTFSIYLPITKTLEKTPPSEPQEIPTGCEKILFVDDEVSITRYGYQTLKRLGYQVTTRTSSVEALSLFKKKPQAFDLVITDMTMPNLTGDELAQELLNIRSDLAVILCTGYSNRISEETATQIGIKAFAYKPLSKARLAKLVRKVLDETKGTPAVDATMSES